MVVGKIFGKMETKEELKKVKEYVLKLLETDERCRNSDKWLTYQVMRKFTNIYIPFEDFEKIPSFESIRRTRAHIQNKEKLFLPTDPAVIKKRRMRAEEWREFFSPKNN